METQWLRNPRLLYMWDSSEHALKELFEHDTQVRFTKNVLNFCGNVKRDESGPTGYKIDNEKECK